MCLCTISRILSFPELSFSYLQRDEMDSSSSASTAAAAAAEEAATAADDDWVDAAAAAPLVVLAVEVASGWRRLRGHCYNSMS